ncbi:MAG TPA: cytochrome c oxidase assembly protein [Bryobacteraceae bacterium]|nr:cytochrome c oxidase assembly protein [Bryobacteraceae bacterium]
MTRRAVLAVCLAPALSLAHEGRALEPHDVWGAWSFDPVIVLCLAVSALLYWRGAWRERGISTREQCAFWAGWAALALALISPLHPVGEVLFSAHMVQHEVLMLVAAPLLVLGRPLVPFVWGLPLSWRRGAGRVVKLRAVERAWRVVTHPLAAWSIHLIALWVWHAPSLFDATLESDWVHTFQHASFLGSALLFWWSLLRRSEYRTGSGAAVLYVFTTAVHTSVLGALLTFAPVPLYPAYTNTVAWGLSAIEDQQLGGLVMWVPGGVVLTGAGLLLFARWIREPEPRVTAGTLPLVALLAAWALASWGCSSTSAQEMAAKLTGGDPGRGKTAIQAHGCPACHTIPGIDGAHGLVGPPLAGLRARVYIGGVVANTPENLVRWIVNPKAIDEKTAMPDMKISEKDARDIAAYLYTLR